MITKLVQLQYSKKLFKLFKLYLSIFYIMYIFIIFFRNVWLHYKVKIKEISFNLNLFSYQGMQMRSTKKQINCLKMSKPNWMKQKLTKVKALEHRKSRNLLRIWKDCTLVFTVDWLICVSLFIKGISKNLIFEFNFNLKNNLRESFASKNNLNNLYLI